jgi:carboxymethylenebutenolidase
MGAYVARPEAPGEYPAVVVAFEIFGVTAHIRDLTERIAALGTVAVAPDFYHRTVPGLELDAGSAADRERGLALSGALTRAEAVADLRAALAWARGAGAADGPAGAVGFSFGGHLAYLAATEAPVRAAAVFYGGWIASDAIALGRPEPTLELTERIAGHDARVLFLCGEQDHVVPAADRAAIGNRLEKAGVRHEMVVYPDTPHGFFADARDSYRPAAASDAWERVRELLATELAARPADS